MQRGFNRALGARRQPGSAFKPFVYAAALTDGYTPASLVDDSPVEITDGARVWRPVNFDGEYAGSVTLRRALMRSANAATVRLSQAVGERRVAALARWAGIRSQLDPVPSLALGAVEVTPLELVAAYAPFANGGRPGPAIPGAPDRAARRHRALACPRAESASGCWARRRPSRSPRCSARWWTVGPGVCVRELGVRGPVAGKTGTTNNGADVWFVGYTPTVVAAVWFGYDAPRDRSPRTPRAAGWRRPAWAAFYRNGWKETRRRRTGSRRPGW